jgi:hypothetical protein
VHAIYCDDVVDIPIADRAQLRKNYLLIHYSISLCPLGHERVHLTPIPEEPLLGKSALS